jgi:hypothetical protein
MKRDYYKVTVGGRGKQTNKNEGRELAFTHQLKSGGQSFAEKLGLRLPIFAYYLFQTADLIGTGVQRTHTIQSPGSH